MTAGAAIVYTIVVGNAGPNSADGAVLADPPPVGATCTAATCTAADGATCPSVTGVALVAESQGGGMLIPTLPANASVSVVLTCTVD